MGGTLKTAAAGVLSAEVVFCACVARLNFFALGLSLLFIYRQVLGAAGAALGKPPSAI